MLRFEWLCLVGLGTVSCRPEGVRSETLERTSTTPKTQIMTHTVGYVTSVFPETFLVLPAPQTNGGLSVSFALSRRRSVRSFASKELSVEELSQLAWATQGITEPVEGLRTAPSAGALYPLEVYFTCATEVLHYVPSRHGFERKRVGDLRESLADAALGQAVIRRAPCTVVITSFTARTRIKYGDRATRYVSLEAGHVAQNLLLEATSRGLAGVPIGAFDDTRVARLFALGPDEEPLYLIALGHPAESNP